MVQAAVTMMYHLGHVLSKRAVLLLLSLWSARSQALQVGLWAGIVLTPSAGAEVTD